MEMTARAAGTTQPVDNEGPEHSIADLDSKMEHQRLTNEQKEIKAAQRKVREALVLVADSSFQNGDFSTTAASFVRTEGAEEPSNNVAQPFARRQDGESDTNYRQSSSGYIVSHRDFSSSSSPTRQGSQRRQTRSSSHAEEAKEKPSAFYVLASIDGADLEQSSGIHYYGDFGQVSAANGNEQTSAELSQAPVEEPPQAARLSQAGAFHAQGNEARAQQKGVLTLLQENNRPMQFAELSCGESDDEAQVEVRDLVEENHVYPELQTAIVTTHKEDQETNRRWLCWILCAVVVVIVVVVGLSVALAFRNDDGGIVNEPTLTECVNLGNELYSSGQPDIHCQCEMRGKITDILDLTKERYEHLQRLLSEVSFLGNASNPSTDLLDSQVLSGLRVWNQSNCDDPQNVALLDLASRNSTDLERYGLMVLYLSLGVFFSDWRLVLNGTCAWPGVSCNTNNDTYIVQLYDTDLWGTLPVEIGLLSHMEKIDVGGSTGLTGTIPTEFGMLDRMKSVVMWDCRLDGTIPTEIGSMSALELLYIEKNGLTSTIPTEIGKIQTLTELHVGLNHLNGELPIEILQLSALVSLDIHSNQMTGMIPSELGALTNLKNLRLGTNEFRATLPTEIWGLQALTFLNLADLVLQGTVPWHDLARMTDLEFLLLGGNSLSGTMSSLVGNLTSLVALDLHDGNKIGGTIPTEIGLLTKMTNLKLSGNDLSGWIPITLAELTNLVFLTLERNNDLSGNMVSFCNSVASANPGGEYVIDTGVIEAVSCSCCITP